MNTEKYGNIIYVTFWLWLTLNPFPNKPWFYVLQYKSFENTVGKGEIARDEQFLLFPTMFSTCLQNFMPFL